jgi:hypothetical protein
MLIDLRLREGFGRLPPPEVLFLHRKLGGLYLLLSRLRATLPVSRLLSGLLEARPDAASESRANAVMASDGGAAI